MRFWDSSAIIPLLVQQGSSTQADAWYEEDPQIVLWTLTSVETISGLQRLARDGLLKESEALTAEERLHHLVGAAHVVVQIEPVKAVATRLLRLHPLRAADALQLGAALCWSQNQPEGRFLITLDAKLAGAAVREGFMVLPPMGGD